MGSSYKILGNGLPSIHSEHAALNNLYKKKLFRNRNRNRCSHLDILVIKLTKTGQLSYSRPCRMCIIRLERSKITFRRIYYSNEHGGISYETMEELVSSKGRDSRGTRNKNRERNRDNKRRR